MNYSRIIKFDVANATGISTTLFVSGCTFNCVGCFNKEAQNFNYGDEFTKEVEDLFISYAKDVNVDCVCILGGEPTQQDNSILDLLTRLNSEVKKPIWLWSGNTFENLLKNEFGHKILEKIDVLIDGAFIEARKQANLAHRGSANQRVIDVKKSLDKRKIVQYNK